MKVKVLRAAHVTGIAIIFLWTRGGTWGLFEGWRGDRHAVRHLYFFRGAAIEPPEGGPIAHLFWCSCASPESPIFKSIYFGFDAL